MDERNGVLDFASPAKLNLYLRVVGRRSDGYHLLETLMAPISLVDRIVVHIGPGRGRVEVQVLGRPELATPDNLAVRAVGLYRELHPPAGRCDYRIELEKAIPVAAGLGGGSSNAGRMLAELDRHFGHPVGQDRLEAEAVRLGADVPFFVGCRPALARGIGDQLTPVTLDLDPQTVALVANPGFPLPTGKVFARSGFPLTMQVASGIEARLSWDLDRLAASAVNDLERVAFDEYPVLLNARDRIAAHGARAARMTGSGPTLFGLFDMAPAARAAAGELSAWDGWRTWLVRIGGRRSSLAAEG